MKSSSLTTLRLFLIFLNNTHGWACWHIKMMGSTYNPGQKSLGHYLNIHVFLSFLGSVLKQCIRFEILLQFSLPLTLYKVETQKKFWIHASNIVCGVRGGVGPVCIGKRPRNAKVSQEFCPWLSEKEMGRKKAILRVFQACKSVFSGFWWKVVIEQTFSQLFVVFWTCFKNSLDLNNTHQKLWNLIARALFQRIA